MAVLIAHSSQTPCFKVKLTDFVYHLLKNVPCVCVCVCVCVLEAQLCPTLCNRMDCSLPGSSVKEFSDKNTGMCCHSLHQGISPTQGLNLGFLHCRQILYCTSHQGSPKCPLQDQKSVIVLPWKSTQLDHSNSQSIKM